MGWPYGRRDLYYDPETIPEVYRKPHKKRGIDVTSPELLENGGLNHHLYNAIYENSLQNGVLTAIEDFIDSTEQEFELVKVPGLHGLGILVPVDLKERNKELSGVLTTLEFPPTARQHIENVERARLETQIRQQNVRAELKKVSAERKEQVKSLMSELKQRYETLQAKELDFRKAHQETAKAHQETAKARQETAKASRETERTHRVVGKLIGWMDELDIAVPALLDSQRWKIGNTLGEFRRRIMLRPNEPMASERLQHVLGEFHSWRNNYGDTPSRPPQMPEVSHVPEQPANHLSASATRSVDVVVCVHNALEDVRSCLSSVVKNTQRGFTLYIVNDGSDAATSEYLAKFCSNHDSRVLLESSEASGYTRAANRGLQASSADYIVLLNSDTLVPTGWVEKLLECGESNPNIGIVGPLSNAASWQSVPKVKEGGDWAVNPLPKGYDIEDLAKEIDRVSERQFPRVPLLNGFCLAIKRPLVEAVGYLDEESFSEGFGEENDYCFRATDAGFELAIADQTYVYHAKSKSYTHERRRLLRVPASEALKRKHGAERISRGVELMSREPTLEKMRRRLSTELEKAVEQTRLSKDSSLRVLFLLPCRAGGGGVHSVVQESHDMLGLGVFARVAIPAEYREQYLSGYPDVDSNLFYFFESKEELIDLAGGFDVAVATLFASVRLLELIRESHPELLPAYYIQDYEPWIVKSGSQAEKEAERSYTAIPDMLCFAKTQWLCETVEKAHDVKIQKVMPGLDHSVYYPAFPRTEGGDHIKIAAMVRPRTPRRSPVETIQTLKFAKAKYRENVSITVFGCEPEDPQFLALPGNFDFENRGVLTREEVSEVLRQADIFLDLSTYQAFGRTGLEAMACGCAVVLPKKGGTDEYARHRQNALLIDTEDFGEMVCALGELVENESFRLEMTKQALLTAASYSVRQAAVSELMVISEKLQKRAEAPNGAVVRVEPLVDSSG